jgi:hypothetical protein
MSTPLERLRARLARKAAARRQARRATTDAELAPPPDAPDETPSPAASAPAEPRLVRRIVWGYEVGVLPVPWLMGYKRLKAMIERAGFAIRVDLLPLSGLPADTDLLCVPDELAEAARAAAPEAYVLALGGRPPQDALQALVDQLGAGVELTAERTAAPAAPASEPEATAPPPAEHDTFTEPEAAPEQTRVPFMPQRGKVVRYRGWERID